MSALPLIATELLHDGKWRDGPKGDNRPVQRQLWSTRSVSYWTEGHPTGIPVDAFSQHCRVHSWMV